MWMVGKEESGRVSSFHEWEILQRLSPGCAPFLFLTDLVWGPGGLDAAHTGVISMGL